MSNAAGRWFSAVELSAVLAVSPTTLELYASRGTLGSRVDERGRRLFDGRAAAAIFRRRGDRAVAPPGPSWGRLGEITLG